MASRLDILPLTFRLTIVSLHVLLATYCQAHAATDTLTFTIHYHLGSSTVDSEYRNNKEVLAAITSLVKGCDSVISASIVSTASPEGDPIFNRKLSERRSLAALSILKELQNPCSISIQSTAIDWDGLLTHINKENSGCEYSDQITALIQTASADGIVTNSIKSRLSSFRKEEPYESLLENIFPELRVSVITIEYKGSLKQHEVVCDTIHLVPLEVSSTLSIPEHSAIMTLPVIKDYITIKKGVGIALFTNLMLDAAMVPNVGITVCFDRGWTTSLSGMYAWWSSHSHGRYWRLQGSELTVRKYLKNSTLVGHHLGIYAQLLRYDFCFGNRGILSSGSRSPLFNHPSWGGGVEYGYSLELAKYLRLDLSIGFGYLTGRYATYRIQDGHSVWTSTRHRHYFGPTRADISLVWLIGKGGHR